MDFSKSRFKALIRIDPKQKEWIRKNMDCRTMSSFLDKIINNYKKYAKNKKNQKVPNLPKEHTQGKTLGLRSLSKNDTDRKV